MRSFGYALFMMSFLIGAAGCGDNGKVQKEVEAYKATVDLLRGHYIFGHEVRAMRPCGEDEDLWVIDRTEQLVPLFGQLVGSPQPDARIFVIATGTRGPAPTNGFGADYPGSFIIEELFYGALEGFGCDFDVTGFDFRASGNEPFWMVEVSGGAMRLSRPGHPVLSWPGVSEELQGENVVLHGTGGELPGTLTISPGGGYDSMSGAYFSLQARFDLDGEIYSGTALRGFTRGGEKPRG